MKLKDAKEGLRQAQKSNSRFWKKYWQKIVDELSQQKKEKEDKNNEQ